MARSKRQELTFAASVLPGLETIAQDEIQARLKNAQIVEQRRGWVVFRCHASASDLQQLDTTEDVFVILFHTTQLPAHRKEAIPLLTQMAARSYHWDQAFSYFSQAQKKAVRRVTYRVIAQLTGQHGFRRNEVRDAVLAGVQARWNRWKPVADDAHLEIWTPIVNDWALIAIRLSDRSMRHRTYKQEHLPASLRPTLAAAMVRLANPRPNDRFCDPMCGAGTILAERARAGPYQTLIGGDIDAKAVQAARVNLLHQDCIVHLWDVRRLPLRSNTLDAVVCNLPFGEQIGSHADNVALYDRFFKQLCRVLGPGGRAVLLTSEKELMRQLLRSYAQLVRKQEILVGVLGQAARIYVLQKA
ncbi:MAG: methyltransferase domain-containing protein [Anaerolineae bacterium]|nr:methyltransferase domain-containing protein [Anaerolineae bacterium]